MQKFVLYVCAVALLLSSLLTDLYSSLREHIGFPSCGTLLQASLVSTAWIENWPPETHVCFDMVFLCPLIERDGIYNPSCHKKAYA
jgi:hypothetical protein